MTGLFDIFDVLYKVMPAWMVYTIFGALLMALLPSWLQWVRKKRIRGNIREYASTSDPDQKHRLQEKLRDHVGQRPKELKWVATLSHEMGAVVLQKYAEQELRMLGEAIPPYPIKDKEKSPPGPGRLHPIEVAARVHQLLEQNLPEPAAKLVDEAVSRHPNDPDLLAAQQAIHAVLSTSDTLPQVPTTSSVHEPQ